MGKLRELLAELRLVFSGRGPSLLDSLLPPLIFLLVHAVSGQQPALWFSIGTSLLLVVLRLGRRQSVMYAFTGLGGVLLAALFVYMSGSGTGYYIPGFFTSALTIMLCFISVFFGRPLVAWTSFLTRRWPLGWYWHPRVRPAYTETTLIWGLAFSLRLAVELWFYQQDALQQLGAARLFFGWPFILVLLVFTYLYGLWRLRRLAGPSVEEFTAGSPPPWQGQTRGF